LCGEKNVILAVDGIQALGRLAINVKEFNVGYLSCGGHKGLLGTMGAGFVYCDEKIVRKVIPPYACYQGVKSHIKPLALTTDFSKIEWHIDSRRFESGNLNYAGIAAIGAGVRLVNTLGINNIETYILELEGNFIEGLKNLSLAFRSPIEREFRSGMPCIYYPLEIEDNVKRILRKHRIYVTIQRGYIRMSISFYNTKKHIEKTIEAFEEISRLNKKAH